MQRAALLSGHLAAGAAPGAAAGAAGGDPTLEELRLPERRQNPTVVESAEAFAALAGSELGLSDWLTVEQERVDAYSVVANDPQWIHERDAADKGSPFGAPVAHGFLTLGLISTLSREALPTVAGVSHAVNYGLNRVRFVAPVVCGTRVRARVSLAATRAFEGGLEATLAVVLEREGEEKPAIVADWVARFYSA